MLLFVHSLSLFLLLSTCRITCQQESLSSSPTLLQEQESYNELEQTLENYDEKSDSALIVIDTEQENPINPIVEKRSSIIQKRSSEDFDEGFTIIIDRESLEENAVQKDEVYQDMERSYEQIQEKFVDEIKQPIKDKHVRVIVITPKDQMTRSVDDPHQEETDSTPQTELDLDIAKLQQVRDKMKNLNTEDKNLIRAVSSSSQEKSETTKGTSANSAEIRTEKQSPKKPFEKKQAIKQQKKIAKPVAKNIQKQKNKTKNKTLTTNKVIQNKQPGHVIFTTATNNKSLTSNNTNKTIVISSLHHMPPTNPHPKHYTIEEHYKKKTEFHRTGDKKSSSTDGQQKGETENDNSDDLVISRPKLPNNFRLTNNTWSDPDSVDNANSSIPSIMEENAISTNNETASTKPKQQSSNTNILNGVKQQQKPSFDPTAKQQNQSFAVTISSALESQPNISNSGNLMNLLASSNSKPSNKTKVINIEKAKAIVQYLNKDPLESWRYPYKTLSSLDLNAILIRSGLVYPGYIERLKGVMRKAITGHDITLSVVGGSISAGGGLYKDRGSIEGLYYKGVVDWWNQWIFPVTGSKMKVNNAAIGSIGTDYFSYCVKNHLKKNVDLVIWELSANDYNRYKTFPTKGARPLERFTRMILDLPTKPALLYLNFFKGIDYKNSGLSDCPNFEDQQEHTIASYYKVPTLSWRAMVCNGLVKSRPGFLLADLFSVDQYHPSLKGHAQSALLILLHLRHVMRAVLQYAIKHDGDIVNFQDQYLLPDPLFIGPKHPEPYCWTLIRPDEKDPVHNTLEVSVASNDGFKIQYATNFPIRFDKVICYKSEKTDKPTSSLKLVFTIPKSPENKDKRFEVAITTHSKWGGSSMIWIDDKNDQPVFIQEGKPGDPGRRTQVDTVASDVTAGTHFLNLWSKDGGFCLAAIMIDAS
ncbi:uncharacterized protein [Clytia hemisphaerica]|uniref:SGNH hydrolase-type esterase domain-containing protein n=1 Tax=Clytia hemisphaerica TaxID=252671 RepID=A0A7M5WSM9_9CNID|eukprot:TCONS_00053457-protein